MLRDPRWQKARLDKMQRAGFACERCGDKETTLNVHHKNYKRDHAPWEYELSNFVCLCRPCHEEIHQSREMLNNLIPYSQIDIAQFISGMIAAQSNNHIVAKIHPREFKDCTEIYLGGVVALMYENLDRDSIERLVDLLDDREFLDHLIILIGAQSVGMR